MLVIMCIPDPIIYTHNMPPFYKKTRIIEMYTKPIENAIIVTLL